MADNGTKGFDENIAKLERMADALPAIERNALQAAADAVAPRLIDATPVRVSEKQGGNSLADYELKAAVRPHVGFDRSRGKLQAIIDFGKLTWIAHIVDVGHNAPFSRLAKKLGRSTGRNTPAHPFVRATQDAQLATARKAYQAAMTEGINAALRGK